MGATISPSYNGMLRMVDPTVAKCDECGAQRFVGYREYMDSTELLKCNECGEHLFHIDFYPTEFEKVEAHYTYTSLGQMFTLLGLPTVDAETGEFPYYGELPVTEFETRLHLLEGSRFHGVMVDMVDLAKRLNVGISWG